MKNVFKRCLKLLTLFSLNNENLTTNFIKDNVIEYRELSVNLLLKDHLKEIKLY